MDLLFGKAGAANLIGVADYEEGVGIDIHDKLIKSRHFAPGNDGHKDRLIIFQVSGRRAEKRAAAVKTVKDCLPDFLIMAAHDVYARLMLSDDKHLVKYEGVDHDKQDSVEDFFNIGEKHLSDQDTDIEHIERHGHGNAQLFFQDKRRNVHAAGGSACPDHDSDARADHKTAKYRAEHGIIGKGR